MTRVVPLGTYTTGVYNGFASRQHMVFPGWRILEVICCIAIRQQYSEDWLVRSKVPAEPHMVFPARNFPGPIWVRSHFAQSHFIQPSAQPSNPNLQWPQSTSAPALSPSRPPRLRTIGSTSRITSSMLSGTWPVIGVTHFPLLPATLLRGSPFSLTRSTQL